MTGTPADKLRLLNSIRNTMAGAGEIIHAKDDYYVRMLDSILRDLKWIYANADKIKTALGVKK